MATTNHSPLDRYMVTEKYIVTRGTALHFPPKIFGKLVTSKDTIYGVVVDMPMSPTLLGTLVMYINGAANLYFNNGAEYIGAAQKYQTVAQPARIAVASAPRLLPEAVKTTATDLPNAQHHYIYLISKNGIYKKDLRLANLPNEFRSSVEKLMEEGVGKDEAIFRLLKETIIASEPIRFEGDGYSEEWKQEAARRGLTNICHVPEALMHYIDNQSKSVLIGERIFNETELNSRLEVELEKYTMKVQIEGRVLGDLAINHIVPTAVAYQNRLLENLRGLKEIFPAEEYEVLSADRKELIREISHRVTSIKVLVRDMTEARKVANHMENYKERAFAYEEKVRPYLDQIRDHIDHLEMEVDDEIWPLPKYRELLFTK